ncbi:protein RRNAD1-like [Drosophila innubila]|uniref:protein RRNAD1-like n=1 Tax=Drosophila innubila TaxID=198719 RepID=UPI00148DDD1F|nr:protein RRNAD1-like [Drosophila innubila]
MAPQQNAATLSPCASQVKTKCSNQNRKIGLKKLHEIEQLAGKIHEHCAETQTQLIIDLGSGLGYLSEALFKLRNNYLILGLEADEQRVESARKRCQKFLPQEALNSISYKKEFIKADANSRARIEGYASKLAQSHGMLPGLDTAIIGLHACADLSISAMILFLTMPQVRSLHIMPCCYHKLALRSENDTMTSTTSPFVNFPLSNGLRNAISAATSVGCFNRPFMRLACQETSSRWRKDSFAHADHGRQMYMRALANALCDVEELVKVKVCSKPALLSLEDRDSFNELQQRYQLYSQQTGNPLDWRHVHEERFIQIGKRYSDGRGCRLAEALCCLQTSMQKLCENLVLYDRLCFLKDAAAGQQLQLEVRYEKLFDEQISPRCHVLIAKKL